MVVMPGMRASENDDPGVLVQSALRFFQFLPCEETKVFLDSVAEKSSWLRFTPQRTLRSARRARSEVVDLANRFAD